MSKLTEKANERLDRYKIKDENRRRSYTDGFFDGYLEGYLEMADKMTEILRLLTGPTRKTVIRGEDVAKELMDPRDVEVR